MEDKIPDWELFFLNELDEEHLKEWETIKNDPIKSQRFRDIELFFSQNILNVFRKIWIPLSMKRKL